MWRLGDAWVEAEPTTEELEEGTVRMIFEDGFMFDYLGIWQWRWPGNGNDDDIWHLAMVTFVTQVSSILRLPLSREHHGQGLQCLVNRKTTFCILILEDCEIGLSK